MIANLTSGGGTGAVRLRELLGLLKGRNVNVEVFTTQRPGHAIEFGRQVKEEDLDCMLVLGGDGTISEVAKGYIGAEAPVATIPCGSGNDLAGSLGIPRDLEEAVEIIYRGNIIKIDLFRDCGVVFAETVGCGFAADVVASAVKLSRYLHGPTAYFAGVLETLSHFKSADYDITIDDQTWKGKASMVIINNTFRVGGGMKITPDAVMDDGLLDIAIFKTSSKLALLRLLPKIYSGGHTKSPHVIIRRGKKFTIKADQPLRKMADGDIVGTLPIEVEVIPAAMNFFRY